MLMGIENESTHRLHYVSEGIQPGRDGDEARLQREDAVVHALFLVLILDAEIGPVLSYSFFLVKEVKKFTLNFCLVDLELIVHVALLKFAKVLQLLSFHLEGVRIPHFNGLDRALDFILANI